MSVTTYALACIVSVAGIATLVLFLRALLCWVRGVCYIPSPGKCAYTARLEDPRSRLTRSFPIAPGYHVRGVVTLGGMGQRSYALTIRDDIRGQTHIFELSESADFPEILEKLREELHRIRNEPGPADLARHDEDDQDGGEGWLPNQWRPNR